MDKIRLNNIISEGGWHFCNLKDPESLKYKYENLCETDDPIIFKEKIDDKYLNTDEIRKNIISGLDIIGRNDKFVKIEIDNSFPKYLIENINLYKNKWFV